MQREWRKAMKDQISAGKVFFGVAIINICIVYIILLVSKGEFVYALTYDESNFCDFWSHVRRLLYEQNIYSSDADAIFPPLAYLFLKMFARPLAFKIGGGILADNPAWLRYAYGCDVSVDIFMAFHDCLPIIL